MKNMKAKFIPANRTAPKAIMAEPTPVLSMADAPAPRVLTSGKLSHAEAKNLANKRGCKAATNKATVTDSGIFSN